ncbi:MAG: hypothetical protein V3W51_04170 [Candidatus Brocadiales bacterium]
MASHLKINIYQGSGPKYYQNYAIDKEFGLLYDSQVGNSKNTVPNGLAGSYNQIIYSGRDLKERGILK